MLNSSEHFFSRYWRHKEFWTPGRVLFENTDYLVVNKPHNLPVELSLDKSAPSLRAFLAQEYAEVFFPHRLDAKTSGVMVVAKNPEASARLSRQFAKRTVGKTYIAVLENLLSKSSYSICKALILDAQARYKKMKVCDAGNGKEANTYLRKITDVLGRSVVMMRPKTGRMHQLRVHASTLLAPILGDPLYANDGRDFDAMLSGQIDLGPMHLHAWRLRFTYKSKRCVYTAPLPAHIQKPFFSSTM